MTLAKTLMVQGTASTVKLNMTSWLLSCGSIWTSASSKRFAT
jgi:hypothetical protein